MKTENLDDQPTQCHKSCSLCSLGSFQENRIFKVSKEPPQKKKKLASNVYKANRQLPRLIWWIGKYYVDAIEF